MKKVITIIQHETYYKMFFSRFASPRFYWEIAFYELKQKKSQDYAIWRKITRKRKIKTQTKEAAIYKVREFLGIGEYVYISGVRNNAKITPREAIKLSEFLVDNTPDCIVKDWLMDQGFIHEFREIIGST